MTETNPEYARQMEILSGLPGLSDHEQRAEIGDRMARGELVQVNEVWFERVDLSPEAAAAGQRAIQAVDEARPHSDDGMRCGFDLCQRPAGPSGRCDDLAHAVPPRDCGCGGPLTHDSEDRKCAYFAGTETGRG